MSIINLITEINSAKKAEKLYRDEVEKLNKNRFKKLLKHVLTNSKFYQEFYRQSGITINNYKEVSYNDLPVIDKALMMENYNDFVTDKLLKQKELESFIANPLNRGKKYLGRYQVIHTSGSTGKVGIFVYGQKDWNLLKALVLTRVSKAKINPFKKTKIAFIGAVDGMYAGISLAKEAPKLIYDFLPLSINSPIKEINKKIDAFKPDILSGYSSGNYLLAKEQKKGNINISPKRIICSADPLTNEMRRVIEEVFAVSPVNFYAASESIGFGAQCEQYKGIHLFNDWHNFELVDDDLKPVKKGCSGKLVMTNLYNYTQPLIRYKMNDQLVFDEKLCSCNLPFPTIKNVVGRQEDFLWFKRSDGSKDYIHPLLIVEFFVPGVKKFQVIQTAKDELLVKAVVNVEGSKIKAGIRNRLNEILSQKKLEKFVSINIQLVDDIEVDSKTGKYKLIIPFKSL